MDVIKTFKYSPQVCMKTAQLENRSIIIITLFKNTRGAKICSKIVYTFNFFVKFMQKVV